MNDNMLFVVDKALHLLKEELAKEEASISLQKEKAERLLEKAQNELSNASYRESKLKDNLKSFNEAYEEHLAQLRLYRNPLLSESQEKVIAKELGFRIRVHSPGSPYSSKKDIIHEVSRFAKVDYSLVSEFANKWYSSFQKKDVYYNDLDYVERINEYFLDDRTSFTKFCEMRGYDQYY